MSPHDVSDESVDGLERFPSGQREQTVNLPAYAFEGSNPSLSTSRREAGMIGVAGQDVRGNSSVGRASASQAEGRGFEPRFPLQDFVAPPLTCSGGVVVLRNDFKRWSRMEPFGAVFGTKIREGEITSLSG